MGFGRRGGGVGKKSSGKNILLEKHFELIKHDIQLKLHDYFLLSVDVDIKF